MRTQLDYIKFTIDKGVLFEALEFLSPFIEEKEDESEMILPQPYFYDKVTFVLYKTYACLSVITKEGVRVERICDIESNVEQISFCIHHASLMQKVFKYCAESFTFIDDRFFGFDVYNTKSGKYQFEIEAHSIRNHPENNPESHHVICAYPIELEYDKLIKVLKEFPKYTSDCGLRHDTEYIWFQVKNGSCRVVAESEWQFRLEVFPTKVIGDHVFSLLGKFASRIYDIIANCEDYDSRHHIGYNRTSLIIYKENRSGRYDETIEIPLCVGKSPSFLSPMILGKLITFRSSVNLKDLQSALRTINAMDYEDDYVLMHFFPDHVNIYHGDPFSENRFFLFIDADGYGEYTVKLRKKEFEAILEDIYTDDIRIILTNNSLLNINNENEPILEAVFRILWLANLEDKDLKLLERGDQYLNSHEGYIEKYLIKHNDEEESPKEEYANIEEMKAEALLRMKEVIDDTNIIDYFEETGVPQLYYPPFGESCILEDDELHHVRNIESDYNVLVWGVIRCKMMYNRHEVTVYCMLHVSQNKDEWEQEREDLSNGTPFVYTVMKEYPITDHGHINVYKSNAGTLLRR